MADVLDPRRLAALASYDILDTAPEQGFDDVVLLAQQICDAPVALVSLVAADRQWFKARSGFPLCETDLNASVCAHALAEPDLLVIEDLTRDLRTQNNPLVLGEPFIRFYAGAPLRTEAGDVLGTLCVIDTVPRPMALTEAQADGLRRLARQVINLLELRKAVSRRDAALDRQDILVQQRRTLLETQRAVSEAAGDLDAVFAALVAGTMKALPAAEGGVVELIDGDDLVYHSPQGVLRGHAGLRVPLRGTLAGRSALGGRPLRIADAGAEEGTSRDLLSRLMVGSCLLVPISRAGTVIGVLKLQSKRPDAFDDEDLQVARLFAGEAMTGLAEIGEAKARKAVQASESRYRSVFDSITDFALIVVDHGGMVTEWNTGAERILGWSADEMRGHDIERIFTPEDRAEARARTEMRLSLEDGRASNERWHLRQDGQRFWASGEMMPLRDDEGRHQGYVKVLRDRTAEHLAGKALEDAEARLRESEDHLWHTVELNPAVPWTCDPQGNITSYSKRWLNLTGQAPGEPDGAGWMKALHPDDVANTSAVFADRLASGEPVDVDYRIRVAATGEYRWMRARARPRRGADGAVMRWYGVVEDVHDRKVAEAALRQSEERFRTILGTVEAAFAIVQVKFDADDRPIDYRFLEANPAFEREAGINLQGKWVSEFAPDLEPFWFETYGRVAKTREPATFENYAEAFKRWFDVRAVPVGDPDERQIAIIFNDVTVRRDAEARLRASEALARANIERVQLAMAAGAIIGTWHWDLPSNRVSVDEGFARGFGLDPMLGCDDLDSRRILASVHTEDRDGVIATINEAIERGGAFAHQCRVRRADGRYYWIEANGRVDKSPDGTPLSFPGVLLDVEERRAVEQERDRATAALRALNDTLEQRVAQRTAELMRTEEALRQSQKMEAVGQLTGGVAHDFNNLLTIIRSSIDLLRRPNLPDERRRRYIDAVSETVDRAAKLTGQLLAFARRQALKPEVFDVGMRLTAIADMLDTVTGARIKVVTELSEAPCFIKADLSQFETALVNMAVNARDAMEGAGQITLRLTCGVRMPPIRGHAGAKGPFVAVSLSDTGEGIPPERLSRIFEPFFTTKEVGKGTGLGLSQVFGFAKQSGGDVDVRSEVARGTTFTLYLPEVEAETSLVPGEEKSDEPSDGVGLRVLVVEDNIEVGQFATQILQDLGYEPTWAANAEEALTRLGKDGAGFDVVFSDVVMPGMGGIALARELQQRLPTMPIVLASGYSHVLAEEGAHGFELLNKPYSADHLSRTLRRVIRR